jgi:hypothetical protein
MNGEPDTDVHVGVLREVVKDQAALGRQTIPIGVLLRRLGFAERLEAARSRLSEAAVLLDGGEADSAAEAIAAVDAELTRLLER